MKSLNVDFPGLGERSKRKGTGGQLGDLSLHPSPANDPLRKLGAASLSLYLSIFVYTRSRLMLRNPTFLPSSEILCFWPSSAAAAERQPTASSTQTLAPLSAV